MNTPIQLDEMLLRVVKTLALPLRRASADLPTDVVPHTEDALKMRVSNASMELVVAIETLLARSGQQDRSELEDMMLHPATVRCAQIIRQADRDEFDDESPLLNADTLRLLNFANQVCCLLAMHVNMSECDEHDPISPCVSRHARRERNA